MNEDEKPPFFINTRRLQRADSYFEIGRAHEKLRKLLAKKRSSSSTDISPKDFEEQASVGFYGVNRFISLEPDPEDGEPEDREFIEIDEDVQFENTSAFSLFWMTFKRIALSIGEHFTKPKYLQDSLNDPECNKVEDTHNANLCKVVVDPSFHDPRVKQSRIIYGDVNYLVQKFRMNLNCGSLDIALFSVEFPKPAIGTFESTDLQAYVVSPDCGSFVWIENNRASAIFMTRSSTDFFGNVLEWFRKILSDMALADSVMIGHPYYWNATVRRRLSRVMRYLKRLYRNLALKQKQKYKITEPGIRTDAIEVICPTEVSKVVIHEQESGNLPHTNSTYEKLNIMLEQLVKKWFQYQNNLKQSRKHTVTDISRAWSQNNPQALERGKGGGYQNFLESVTFLDFNVNKREQCDGETNGPCELNGKDINNNDLISRTSFGENKRSSSSVVSGLQQVANNFQVMEGCHLSRSKSFKKSSSAAICIDIEESSEHKPSGTTLPPSPKEVAHNFQSEPNI